MKNAAKKAIAMQERDAKAYRQAVANITIGWAAEKNLEFLGDFKVLITDASYKGQTSDKKQGYGSVQVEADCETILFGRTEVGSGSADSEYTGTLKSLIGVQERWSGKDLIVLNDNKRVIEVLSGQSPPTEEEDRCVGEIREAMKNFKSVHFLKSTEDISSVSDHVAKYGINELDLDLGAERSCKLEEACSFVFQNNEDAKQYGRSVNKYREAMTRWRNLIQDGLASESKNENVGLLSLLSGTINAAKTKTTVKKELEKLKRKGSPGLGEEGSSNQRQSKKGTASAEASDDSIHETEDVGKTKDVNKTADEGDGDATS